MKEMYVNILALFAFAVCFSAGAGSSKMQIQLCGIVKGEEFQFLGPAIGTDPDQGQFIHKMNFSAELPLYIDSACPIAEGDNVVVTGLFKESNWFVEDRRFVYLIPDRCLLSALENNVSYLFELEECGEMEERLNALRPPKIHSISRVTNYREKNHLRKPSMEIRDLCEQCQCC